MFQFWRYSNDEAQHETEQDEKLKQGFDAVQSIVSPLSVMLVEDDIFVADTLKDLLINFGCDVEWLASAEAALNRLNEGRLPSLILSDIRMGRGRTGTEMAEEISRTWPNIKVVLMTGYSDAFDALPERQRATVLFKPIEIQKLYAALMAGRPGMPSNYKDVHSSSL